jgi:hypothetical protein
VKDLSKALKKEKQTIYRAMELLELYQNREFSKEGKTYLFNDHEKQMIQEVVENGIKAAKPTMRYGEKKEVIL